MELPNPDDLIDEQIAYYRARAAEYDQWWLRMAKFDLGEEFRQQWEREGELLRIALADFGPRGEVLELAAGTGNWTVELLRHADRVTAVDASPEVLAINRQKARSDRVEYIETDLFSWQPPRRFDVVFFSFWLTHVPPAAFDQFWALVDAALAPDGRVCFLDNAIPLDDVPAAISVWSHGSTTFHSKTSTTDIERGISLRQLNDGREFTIVKVLWEPEALRERLTAIGWDVSVHRTGPAFIYGHGGRLATPR